MPWSGSAGSQTYSRTNGVHSGSTVWQQDAAATIGIRADYHDVADQDIATALNLCLKQDGGTSMTAALPMGGNNINNAGIVSGKVFIPTEVALTDASSVALNAASGGVFVLNSTHANPTILVPTNPTAAQSIIIYFANTSGGPSTLALTGGANGFHFGTDITGLTATPNNAIDIIGCIYLANVWFVAAYMKGF